jgi:ABC-type phosphate/phosphonate transport system substrate-binding protein
MYFNQEKDIDGFRTIYTTQALPHALFVVHPRVPKAIREKIQERILSWERHKKGRRMLDKGKILTFKKTSDSEYDSIRQFIQSKD